MNEEELLIKREAFHEAIKPALKYLCENHNPHCTIIITPTHTELLEGTMAIEEDGFIVD